MRCVFLALALLLAVGGMGPVSTSAHAGVVDSTQESSLVLLNLTSAHVVILPPEPHASRLPAYAAFLVSAVLKRARTAAWSTQPQCSPDVPCVQLSVDATRANLSHAEAYELQATTTATVSDKGSVEGVAQVRITGSDNRGVLYGVGRLLRLLNITFDENYAVLPVSHVLLGMAGPELRIVSWPQRAIRGHQLGYRPKTNSYDSWTSDMFTSYILDLAVFGTNHIDLLPPNTDDFVSSPHFLADPLTMLSEVSAACDTYDINCSLWYPAMYGNYSDPKVLAAAEAEWATVFGSMPRLDGIFIPGGDPGQHSPTELMAIAAVQGAFLRKYHPGANVWLSPQFFSPAQMKEWNEQVALPSTRTFLTGIVYGPWVRLTLEEFAPTVPSGFPVRNYPDLGHSLSCELPVPEWDYAFAFTEGRETINPRPRYHAAVAAHDIPLTAGFAGYSEGCNDDVNKMTWSAMYWGPDQETTGLPFSTSSSSSVGFESAASSSSFPSPSAFSSGSFSMHSSTRDSAVDAAEGTTTARMDTLINATMRDYASYFGGSHLQDVYTELLFGLEQNWVGPVDAKTSSVEATFATAQRLEAMLTVRDRFNWRLMQARYRAYYDMIVRVRTLGLKSAETDALAALAEAGVSLSSLAAMDRAETIIRSGEEAVAAAIAPLHLQLRVLGEGLYQTIHMKLSVPMYGAEFTERGANLDTVNVSLTSAPFLMAQFGTIRQIPSEDNRLAALHALLAWEDAGHGGFYDDLGDLLNQPHLVPGEGPPRDPSYYRSPMVDFAGVGQQGYPPSTPAPALPVMRVSQLTLVRTHYGGSVFLQYPIVAGRHYNVSITYTTDDVAGGTAPVMLLANNATVHDFIHPQPPTRTLTFPIPPQATSTTSTLVLECRPQPLCPQEKNGCAISEVWLRLA